MHWKRITSLFARLKSAIPRRRRALTREELEAGLDQHWLQYSQPYVRESKHRVRLSCYLLILEVRNGPHGWPRLSAAIDSDPNFMIYRRFGYLRTRLLTYHQDVLRELEEALDKLDHEDYSKKATRRAMCYREGDDARQPSRRKELLQSVDKEMQHYGQCILRRLLQSVY